MERAIKLKERNMATITKTYTVTFTGEETAVNEAATKLYETVDAYSPGFASIQFGDVNAQKAA